MRESCVVAGCGLSVTRRGCIVLAGYYMRGRGMPRMTDAEKEARILKKKADLNLKLAAIRAGKLKRFKQVDARRKMIVGNAMLRFIELHPDRVVVSETLETVLDAMLTREDERALFSLPPKDEGTVKAVSAPVETPSPAPVPVPAAPVAAPAPVVPVPAVIPVKSTQGKESDKQKPKAGLFSFK